MRTVRSGREKRAGSLGRAGSFSFQNGKVMTAGEGGILVSNDEGLMDAAREIVNQGRRKGEAWFAHYSLGTNYRMTAFQAAVLYRATGAPAGAESAATGSGNRSPGTVRLPGASLSACPAGSDRTYELPAHRLARWRSQRISSESHGGRFSRTPFYPHTLYNNPLYRDGIAPCRVTPCPVAEARIADGFWIPHRVLLGDENDARSLAHAMRNALRG